MYIIKYQRAASQINPSLRVCVVCLVRLVWLGRIISFALVTGRAAEEMGGEESEMSYA